MLSFIRMKIRRKIISILFQLLKAFVVQGPGCMVDAEASDVVDTQKVHL